MRLLKTMLLLLAFLAGSAAAKADYNPTNPPEPGVYFTLTTRCIPQDGGYNLTSSGTHAFGSNVYLNVYPNTGYRFTGWKDEDGNVLSTSTSFNYTMPSKDVTVTATFVYDPSNPGEPSTPVFKNESRIDFAVNPPDGGYFSGNYAGTYEVGTNHSFSVRTNSGYRFVNWTRNGEVVGASSTLKYTVPKGDHTLVANFEYDPDNPGEPGEQHFYRKLTLVSNPEGGARLYGAGEYLDGSSQRIYMNVNDYYTFVNWTDENGEVFSESKDFYLTMPNRNITLTANFTYNYDPANPGEPGTPNPGGSVGTNMVAWPRMGMYDNTHVQILCETQGSTIHYTLDGTDPTAASPVYTNPVFVGSNLLVKAIAFKEGMEDSPVVSYRVTAYKTHAPVYTFENKMVKITSETPGAIIRYTLDFTEPNAESEVYTSPFLPEENCRIKAYASKEGLTDSPVSIYVYRRAEHTLPAPTFSLNSEGKLVITPPVRGGETRYTMDGSEPNDTSTLYLEPITVPHNCTVKAYTKHINYFDSPVASYEVTDFVALPPTINFEDRKITIYCATEDAEIRYTIDGSEPTATSILYSGPFLPANDCTVKAYASKEGMNDSPVTSYVYIRAEHTVPAPTFVLNEAKRLVIVPAMSGCESRYTTDGTEPEVSSRLYTEPIVLPDYGSVKAYSTLDNYFDSPVVEYVIAEHQEMPPTIMADFRERVITIEHPDSLRVALTIDGETIEIETPHTMDVYPGMAYVSAVALTEDADMLNSLPEGMDLIFHERPELHFDGHTVYAAISGGDPMPEYADGILLFNGEIVSGGGPVQHYDVSDFGTAMSVVISDHAFRSDVAGMDIDFFNTGRKAGARNGHRLHEAFEDWGAGWDSTCLEVVGEVARADLQFISTLSELTSLRLNPDFITAENCDSVLAESRIETICSTAYPAGMLKGMRRLTTVMWPLGDANMPAGRISENGNPNILFWTTNSANAPEDARNIVVYSSIDGAFPDKGEAEEITLEAGYPFNAHRPIEAKQVVFSKLFGQETVPGKCQGWETIALPFTPDRMFHESGTEIMPFSLWPGVDEAPRPFWLYTAAEGSDWQPAERIIAGMPYIISMPNNPDYIYYYNLAGRIIFMASDVTLGTEDSAPLTTTWKSRDFTATFMPVEETGILSLNVNGEENGVSGSRFVADAETLPFGAYAKDSGSLRSIPVFDDSGIALPSITESGLAVDSPAPGTIRISSLYDCRVAVTAITGITVATADVRAGETVRVDGFAKGLYIVSGKKIMVK